MAKGGNLGSGWSPWGRDVGLGFSFKAGNLRADMAPRLNPDTKLVEWCAVAWKGDDRSNVVVEVWGETHWHAAAALEREVVAHG